MYNWRQLRLEEVRRTLGTITAKHQMAKQAKLDGVRRKVLSTLDKSTSSVRLSGLGRGKGGQQANEMTRDHISTIMCLNVVT